MNMIWYDITPFVGGNGNILVQDIPFGMYGNPCMCGTSLREEELLYESLPRMRQYV